MPSDPQVLGEQFFSYLCVFVVKFFFFFAFFAPFRSLPRRSAFAVAARGGGPGSGPHIEV